jgi:hypothetical protein
VPPPFAAPRGELPALTIVRAVAGLRVNPGMRKPTNHRGPRVRGTARLRETDFGGSCAFSPDGKTLALTGSLGTVRLLETDTGRDIARLTVPEQTNVRPYVFSSDGTKLTAIGTESQLLYLWDLRVLRAGLKELGLDWDQPAYTPAAAPVDTPLQVEVDLGEFSKK